MRMYKIKKEDYTTYYVTSDTVPPYRKIRLKNNENSYVQKWLEEHAVEIKRGDDQE